MRKLKLQVQMTIDGFIAGPSGELDSMTFNWSDDLKEYVKLITDPVDTILLGRKLAEGFIPYWTSALNSPAPEEGAEKMVTTPKIVFTKTLKSSLWDNTMLANGELADEIHSLKKQQGGDLIVYGGAGFVSSLIREQLIDELHLFINPVAIGQGLPIFYNITEKINYQLIHAKKFDCGIVVLNYQLS